MRRVLIAVGVVVMGFAVVGALTDDGFDPVGVVVFLGGVVIAHDLVLMPLVLAAGALIERFVPGPARTAVRVAALCGLALTVVAAPLVAGFGRVADDPSVLPRPYGRGLLLALALVWAFAAAVPAGRMVGRIGRRRAVRRSKATVGDGREHDR
jgi:hypothetical protein